MDIVTSIRNRLEKSRGQIENHQFDQKLREGLADSLEGLALNVELNAASVFIYSKRHEVLHNLADYQGGVNFINRVRFENGFGLSAWVAKKQQPIYLPDIHRGSRHGHSPIRSYISIPMMHDEEVVGVLNIAHTKPHAFERQEMMVIKSYIESLKPILQMYQRHQYAYRAQKENPAHR